MPRASRLALSLERNGTRGSARGVKAKTRIKAGKLIVNHNGTVQFRVRSRAGCGATRLRRWTRAVASTRGPPSSTTHPRGSRGAPARPLSPRCASSSGGLWARPIQTSPTSNWSSPGWPSRSATRPRPSSTRVMPRAHSRGSGQAKTSGGCAFQALCALSTGQRLMGRHAQAFRQARRALRLAEEETLGRARPRGGQRPDRVGPGRQAPGPLRRKRAAVSPRAAHHGEGLRA